MPVFSLPSNSLIASQAETFKALAHPARVTIVHALGNAEEPVCACDLAEVAMSTPSTASRHLGVLRQAGIVSSQRRGQQIFYRLERPCVLTFMECCSS